MIFRFPAAAVIVPLSRSVMPPNGLEVVKERVCVLVELFVIRFPDEKEEKRIGVPCNVNAPAVESKVIEFTGSDGVLSLKLVVSWLVPLNTRSLLLVAGPFRKLPVVVQLPSPPSPCHVNVCAWSGIIPRRSNAAGNASPDVF